MTIYIQTNKNRTETPTTGADIRAYRRAAGIKTKDFAGIMGLKNKSSLLQYECGSKPLSKKISARFKQTAATITGLEEITPSRIAVKGSVKTCECGCDQSFIGTARARFFCDACRARAWKRKHK